MKILFLTTHLDYGGISVYILQLAEELQRRGHHISVASSGGKLVKELTQAGIEHFEINIATKSEISPKLISAYLKLLKFMGQNRPDVIHAHTRVTQVLAHMLSRKTRIPYITTCHGFFRARLSRQLFPCWGRRVIAISEVVREHLINDFKIKKERAKLIYNGIDVDRFSDVFSHDQKKVFRKNAGIEEGIIIGIIARLSTVKGHRYLLSAMEQVCRKRPDAKLLIVGDGPLKKDLASRTKALSCSESIIFRDGVADTRGYLSIIDIFILPSVQEGLGLSLIEAMAMGKPVIASDVGGIYTMVKDRKTGILVPPGKPADLAGEILNLIENPDLSREIAKNAQALIKEKFTLKDMADKTEKVYEEVIN